MYASPQLPVPPLRLRHFVGWFRFTFLALTLCMYFTYTDIYSAQRAQSRVPPARRGGAPSAAISPPSACARARHLSSPVHQSPSLFISCILPPHETHVHTWAVPNNPSSARTGAPQSAAPLVNHTAPPCRGRAIPAPCCSAYHVCPLVFHSTAPRGVPASRALCVLRGSRCRFHSRFALRSRAAPGSPTLLIMV